ncbi:hypothetical protein [Neobacillus citreus]|uniref:Uncharacterized protein n=1 Tax=Neobacillus citreus TaxID=2833578 RepID=A0A9J6MP35_9BACI|nr:hypothetical protein [Neobacillus citreus]MCH6265325.1 hypothetical protein [Neobacillus citreus]
MPLVCLNCHESTARQVNFFQISRKYKDTPYKREIKQPTNGIHLHQWDECHGLQLEDGIYCQGCQNIINEEFLTPDEKVCSKISAWRLGPLRITLFRMSSMGSKRWEPN